ncbi:MAG: PAS domain S-box protein [Ignavibacteriaceae bacterium]|nr:PAS domain S-box protein [Ignavibacteriaceae bacterium]
MDKTIEILLVEDNEIDAELIEYDLSESDLRYNLRHTSKKDEFILLARKHIPDVILSDYYMEGFTGFDILQLRNEMFPDIPFVLITGSVSEDIAVKCMKAGADDYLLKSHRKRLPFAIREALDKRNIIKDKNSVLRELFLTEKKYRTLAESSSDIFFIYKFLPAEGFEYISNSCLQNLGYEESELCHDSDILSKIIHPDDLGKLKISFRETIQNPVLIRWIKKDGSVFWGEHVGVPLYDHEGRLIATEGILRNVTGRIEKESILKESEKRYRLLFENNPRAMWVYDSKTLKFLEVNDAAIEIYGYTREEFLGLTIADIRPPEDVPKLFENVATAKKMQQYSRYWRHRKKDGTIIYADINSHEIEYQDKKARLVLVTDVTEKRETELRLNLVQRATEQVPVCIMITNNNGFIEYVNPSFLKLTGYSVNEVIGKTPSLLRSGYHDTGFYKNLWDTIKSGQNWSGEIRNRLKNGELVWENVIISPVKDSEGTITHFVAVKEDVTRKKELIDEIIRAKNSAEEMSRLKSSFLANMSHELRTPMIGLLGYTEIISEIAADEEILEYAEKMNKSGMRLMETLNQILDLSKLESEKVRVTFAPVNVTQIVNEVIDDFTPEAANKKLVLSFETDHHTVNFVSDERMLRSIITNLVSNAVKYTEEGYVKISLKTVADDSGNSLEIAVEDTGIGIAAEYHGVIFEEFRQVSEGFGRAYEGTGLGLTLAKKMTESLGGALSLKSEPGKGSTFTLTLGNHSGL